MGANAQTLRLLRQAWTEKVYAMRRMDQGTSVKPSDPNEVFQISQSKAPEEVHVECGPAVFKLCEKAGETSKNMYVVVQGWIRAKKSSEKNGKIQTSSFSTTVGYFRLKKNQLEHVYGVHYDMDGDDNGHPIFHSQFRPAKDLAEQICIQYRVNVNVVDDHAKCMLRNVRVPTAQMDFFSVFTQLCADHLISNNANTGAVTTFHRLRLSCHRLQGVAHRLSYLTCKEARECLRSSHWYGGH